MFAIPKQPRVIVAKGEGQLGNRLFQASTFLAASYEVGFEVWNPAFGEYAEFFPAISGDALCRPWKKSGFAFTRRALCRTFALASVTCAGGGVVLDITRSHDAADSEYDLCGQHFANLLKRRPFVIAKGWKFRAREALWKHREKIRGIFKPMSSIQGEVQRRVVAASEGIDLLVGVHVRLGDYAEWQGGRYFFQIGEYARWMHEVVEMNGGRRVGFLVCSNGNVDALLKDKRFRATHGPGSAVADLYALAACDLLIGPPSTFTLWASYYGQVPLHMLETADQRLWEGGFVMHERV
jgi:hypothetical protein